MRRPVLGRTHTQRRRLGLRGRVTAAGATRCPGFCPLPACVCGGGSAAGRPADSGLARALRLSRAVPGRWALGQKTGGAPHRPERQGSHGSPVLASCWPPVGRRAPGSSPLPARAQAALWDTRLCGPSEPHLPGRRRAGPQDEASSRRAHQVFLPVNRVFKMS